MNFRRFYSTLGVLLVLCVSIIGPTRVLGSPEPPPCPPGMIAGQDEKCDGKTIAPDRLFADPVAPSATGGPDFFGYTWDDSSLTYPFAWKEINATGTRVLPETPGGTADDQVVGPLNLPFNFKFYENTYNQIYVSANGLIGFDSSLLARHSDNQIMPFDYVYPQNAIAAFWDDLVVPGSSGAAVYTGSGVDPTHGAYYVIEWYQVTRIADNKPLRFEIILYQNGNIQIQYDYLDPLAKLDSATVGMEDVDGVDGLLYLYNASGLTDSLSIVFQRPGVQNRVKAFPYELDELNTNRLSTFRFFVRNTGELGQDLFDLDYSTTGAGWSAEFYAADGETPLIDNGGGPEVDTGILQQGDTFTVTVKVLAPYPPAIGDETLVTIEAKTASLPLRTGEVKLRSVAPANFAHIYREGQSVIVESITAQAAYSSQAHKFYTGSDFSLSNQSPLNGNLVSVREKNRDALYVDLEYSILNGAALVVLGDQLLPQNFDIYPSADGNPVAAAAPNGNIGIAWLRKETNLSTGDTRDNVMFTLMDQNGVLLYPSPPFYDHIRNVTGKTEFNGSGDDILTFHQVQIEATPDNNFHLAWVERNDLNIGVISTDVNHAVYSAVDGAEIKGPTRITPGTIYDGIDYNEPAITNYKDGLNNDLVMIAYFIHNAGGPSNHLAYTVWPTTNGAAVITQTNLYSAIGAGLDLVQLSDQRVGMAWTTWTDPNQQLDYVSYVILEQNLTGPGAPILLPNPDDRQGGSVSITRDESGNAILTWSDVDWLRRLYYALVNHLGQVTEPMILEYSPAETSIAIQTRAGYGNTYLKPWQRLNLPVIFRP